MSSTNASSDNDINEGDTTYPLLKTSQEAPLQNTTRKSERALVFGYFFTTWNARSDSWAISLFLALLFPDNLLPISIYSFSGSLSCLLFGPAVGWIVDRSPRFPTVTIAIILQKLLICTSAFLLLLKLGFTLQNDIPPNLTLDWYFYLLVVNGSALQVINLVSRLALERDWSSCISKASNNQISLTTLNSRLRFIDLGCDLAAPLVVSAVSSVWNIQIAMLFVLCFSALSIPLEWATIRFVYRQFPALAEKSVNNETRNDTNDNNSNALNLQAIKMLWSLPVTTTCFSVSVLYLSVMTINTVSVAYLLSRSTDMMIISVARGVSVVCGVLSTITLERMVSRIGLESTGLVAVWYQFLCLIMVAISFYLPLGWGDTASVTIFLAGICLSRWGLWTFDLVQQQLLQENVPSEYLGVVSGVEISLQNLFQMIAYTFTIIWSAPLDFWIPSNISSAAVLLAALSYTYYFVYNRSSKSPDDSSEVDSLLQDEEI